MTFFEEELRYFGKGLFVYEAKYLRLRKPFVREKLVEILTTEKQDIGKSDDF